MEDTRDFVKKIHEKQRNNKKNKKSTNPENGGEKLPGNNQDK